MMAKQRSKLLSRWWMLICSIGLVLVQSCSKTEIGKQLAKSFDEPVESPRIEVEKKENKSKSRSSLSTSPPFKATQAKDELFKPIRKIKRVSTKKEDSYGRSISFQPYRITIKLLRADPSAPAELVINALRMAGVNFEVEKVERLESNAFSKLRVKPIGERP